MTVYSPGKDSFLLANYIESLELDGKKFLDMGTGSGILALKAAGKGAEVTAVDINPEAVENLESMVEEDLEVEVFKSDLFENVDRDFDLVVFNPPYLPGEKGVGDEEIWRGGETGTEITRKFLQNVPEHLEEGGKAFIVLSSRADIEELIQEFDLEIVASRELWFEELYIGKFE